MTNIKPKLNIGKSAISEIYKNAELKPGANTVHYLLHCDTIKNFLREVHSDLASKERFYTWFGIAVSTGLTIATADFKPILNLPGDTLRGVSIAVVFIMILLMIRDFRGLILIFAKKDNIDSLVVELGKRGSVIDKTDESSTS